MMHDIFGYIYVGIILAAMLANGILCIVECIKMRHEKPGRLSLKSEESYRSLYKDIFNYSDERVEAEIKQMRCEAENQDPAELLKDMREYTARVVGGVLFGLSSLCLFFGCVISSVYMLATVGTLGIFLSVAIGWAIAYIYYFLKRLYRQWYTVKGA